MTTPLSKLPTSDYYRLAEAGTGIWAAIATDWVAALGNAAIVDLGGRVLIVDTFNSTRAAADLKEAARRLTGIEAAWVVNTHWHDDHCTGNELFAAAAQIAGTEKTRELILKSAADQAATIADYEAQIAALPSGDPAMEERRLRSEKRLEPLRRTRYVAPWVTVSDRLTLYGERRRAELIAVGTAHTVGDLAVYLPDDRVLASGDVVLNQTHAYVGDGDVRVWPKALARLRALNPETVIPGHGDVGDARAIEAMDGYMRDLLAAGQAAADMPAAGSVEGSPRVPEMPEAYRDWGWPEGWPEAVKSVADKLAAG
jgi:glyoxylase-like metal-dependent hydrolase (beta-lactamase superfamily II)